MRHFQNDRFKRRTDYFYICFFKRKKNRNIVSCILIIMVCKLEAFSEERFFSLSEISSMSDQSLLLINHAEDKNVLLKNVMDCNILQSDCRVN